MGTDAFVPEECRAEWEGYLRYVEAMETPEERRFVTPNTSRASGGLVGAPEEILEQLRELERLGLREVTLLPPMEHARACFREFAEAVIDHY